ncbi:hypothetical protein SO802_021074 [Lithocarpus litseifolius]|uniref:Single-stranded DNA-binding protein n=1 Tax=Lithocarpus litseifolius TaxID=425828 RepID=A0AAW2CFC2_9ROSI
MLDSIGGVAVLGTVLLGSILGGCDFDRLTILVGQVGQKPLQKTLKSGRTVTMFSLGTGGIRNNRRPLDNEDPREYANRCAVQWHRVSVYPDRLGGIVNKHVVPGSILYLEGNLETKIFTDPITGLVRRIREIAIRRNGRLVFLSKGDDAQQASQSELRANMEEENLKETLAHGGLSLPIITSICFGSQYKDVANGSVGVYVLWEGCSMQLRYPSYPLMRERCGYV